jgi:hypothetical protein
MKTGSCEAASQKFKAVNGGRFVNAMATFVVNTTALLLIILIAVVVAAAGLIYWQFSRTRRLRERFGPEYDRAVHETGARREAEAKLERRERRVERLHIRQLEPADRARFEEVWRRIQARFVDDPNAALIDADRLIGEVMSAEGYPILDFEQRAADVSVDHPRVVENYREGHRIAQLGDQGRANTEDLRKAMIHYRTLFDDLIGIHNQQELSRKRAV